MVRYVDGDFLIWTSRNFQKSKNLAGDARAALSIASEGQPYRYVSVEGDVTVSESDAWDVGFSVASRYEGVEGAATFLEEYYVERPERCPRLNAEPHHDLER